MNKQNKNIISLTGSFIKRLFRKVRSIVRSLFILKDITSFLKKQTYTKKRFSITLRSLKPMLSEKTHNTDFDKHYVYHPAWAARCLNQIQPREHVDISSTLHFSAIVSAFIPIKFYDYRPAHLQLDNLQTGEADLISLPFETESISSLSCMHTVEHIGLGRYGDPIDPDGDLKAIKELKRVLAQGGSLLFVVPVGKSKLAFNAHRVYSYQQITDYFSDLTLKECVLISETGKEGEMIYNATEEQFQNEQYGCGCFWFVKN